MVILICQQVVNSEVCPIDELHNPLRQHIIRRIKAEFALQGFAVGPKRSLIDVRASVALR